MAENKYKIIFIGTPAYSVPTLQALINDERFHVVCVITAPDAKIGRKHVLTSPPVKITAQSHEINLLQPSSLKNKELYKILKNFSPDAIVTIAYGQIIPNDILYIPKYGCLNLHASLLPKYRGASPIQAAIAQGEKYTGITLMKMDKGLDTGPIIMQEKIAIDTHENGESLHDKLAQLSAQVTTKNLEKYFKGQLESKPQDNNKMSVAPKLTREDGKINWHTEAIKIERLVRAYYPWPGTWTLWDNQVLKIISVDSNTLHHTKYASGTVFEHQGNLAVQCSDDALIIQQLQLQGKNTMNAQSFLQGYKNLLPFRCS